MSGVTRQGYPDKKSVGQAIQQMLPRSKELAGRPYKKSGGQARREKYLYNIENTI